MLNAAGIVLYAAEAIAASGSVHHIACPLELPADAVRISQAPAGWTPFVRKSLRLSSAEPIFGPPAEKGFLKPSDTKLVQGKGVDTWLELDGPVSGGKWMACSYGGHNEVILSKRIDDATSACTVAYTKDQHGENVLDMSCWW